MSSLKIEYLFDLKLPYIHMEALKLIKGPDIRDMNVRVYCVDIMTTKHEF